VAIDTAPPKGIFSLKWSFLKAIFSTINPLKGNSVCVPSVEWFHYAFCNTMSLEETRSEYERYVVPESRNLPRSSTTDAGKIDFSKPHPPILLVAGEKDNIIPASLNMKNFEAYTNKESQTDFKEFPGRTHYICGQTGWEEVAEHIERWLVTSTTST
jgi:esterase/lipase